MKVLYIGHYREGTGWSQAAIDYISAMDRGGIDVVCRNMSLTGTNAKVPERINELENKDLQGIDMCLQHILPHHLVATNKFKKNVALFVTESSSIKHTPWYINLKNMDYVWVPNDTNKSVLVTDGFDAEKIKVVPYAFDLNKYSANRDKLNLYSANGRFKFYYIGELSDRKNILSIVRAFHSEFSNGENVCLVLKLRKHGVDANTLHKHFSKLSTSIKQQLRIHKKMEYYPPEIVLTAEADDDIIQDLHNTCDCYVSPSHGEGWSIPSFEAMCYGNTPICSNESGPKYYINPNNKSTGTLLNGVYGVCTHGDPAFPEIFTGREEWFIPSESELKKSMRWYFENQDLVDRKAGLEQAQKFSYESVAKIIKDILDE